ncbi:MAG: NTP transferase domain-containing protein [Thiobacillus sp.]|nr:NTP transferase domain-containing protein [Thiobacillus sp.]
MQDNHTWAVVLAAGEGKRLAALTMDEEGRHVPKQFCSLHGGPSLFGLALTRARAVVPDDRVCAVVAKGHERWWRENPHDIRPDNLIVQPRNRGTGNGVLLALAYILKRDPQARLIFLPADHHVLDEETLIQAMSSMLAGMPARAREIFLLGIEPDEADPELGYIIPQKATRQDAQGVRHFVEKPSRAVAGKLIQEDALWNSGIFAAAGDLLLDLFKMRFPNHAHSIDNTTARIADPANPPWTLGHLYQQIPDVDFSHHILQLQVADLRVVPVPQCGWSDLGTPYRVSERLNLISGNRFSANDSFDDAIFLDLADTATRANERERVTRAAM